MFNLKDQVKDDHGEVGTIEKIDPTHMQNPNSWALVNFPSCKDPVGCQWVQLKYLQRVN